MSETKHTPGPWTVRGYPHPAFKQELCEIGFGSDGELICDTVYERADANLIAALKTIVNMWNEGSIGAPSYAERLAADVFLHARAAIAKAEGGAK